jgi:hypothetical protein
VKLTKKIPVGYSRSIDKIRDTLVGSVSIDVKQYIMKQNPLQFINPDKLKLKLNDEEEKTQPKATEEPLDDELK